MPALPSVAEPAARRGTVLRALAFVALLTAVAAVAFVLLRGGTGTYTVKARFLDAGQLVSGNRVEVAGRPIGKVSELRVTDDGRAEIVMRIDDRRYAPLHRGTTMAIRQVGLSGIANRYVDVAPGAESAPEIDEGGRLETTETRGIVDIDMLLNAFDAPARKDLQTILVQGAKGLRGNAGSVNRLLGYLNPAVAQTRALVEDLTRDQAATNRLISSAAVTASTLADRDGDVDAGIASTATTLEALARERTALQSSLRRAPGVMRRARGSLASLRSTLHAVRPALREARPVAAPLATFLRRLVPVGGAAEPVLRDVRGLIAPLRVALRTLPGLERSAVPALRSTTSAVRAAQPIFAGLRPYTIDLIGGLSAVGTVGGFYDANGHYIRVSGQGNTTESAVGVGGLVPDVQIPILNGLRTKKLARCPGAAASARAQDNSNPFVPDSAICEKDG